MKVQTLSRTLSIYCAVAFSATCLCLSTTTGDAQVLYVGSLNNRILQVSVANGSYNTYVNFGSNDVSGMALKSGSTINDKLYVSSNSVNSVFEVTRTSATTGVSSVYATDIPNYIAGIAFNSAGSSLYSVLLANATTPVGTIAAGPNAFTSLQITPGYIDYAQSNLTVDAAGNIYVLNTSQYGSSPNSIVKLTQAGEIWNATTFAVFSENSAPQDIAFDLSGNMYVTLRNANAIAKVSADGSVVDESWATGPYLNTPNGIAFFEGEFYQTNRSGGWINKIDLDGNVTPWVLTGEPNTWITVAVPEPSAATFVLLGGAVVVGMQICRRKTIAAAK